jgi:rhodanese-related sulfurtransferase
MKLFTFLGLFLLATAASCQTKTVNTITVSQAETMMLDQPKLRILDVRTPAECKNTGILVGATQINFNNPDFVEQVAARYKKDEPILIYCAAGGRSGKACAKLEKLGFTMLYNLDGGTNAWLEAGKPVKPGSSE